MTERFVRSDPLAGGSATTIVMSSDPTNLVKHRLNADVSILGDLALVLGAWNGALGAGGGTPSDAVRSRRERAMEVRRSIRDQSNRR